MTLPLCAGWALSDECLFLSPDKGNEDCSHNPSDEPKPPLQKDQWHLLKTVQPAQIYQDQYSRALLCFKAINTFCGKHYNL